MIFTFVVLAYFSPETMLPLSSLIATVVGFALLVKRSSIRFVVQCFRMAFRRQPAGPVVKAPHAARRTVEAREDAAA